MIDENTDISHNIAAGIGSIVSSRDFVNLRHWGQKDGMYMSAGVGVIHPDCPPDKKHVRLVFLYCGLLMVCLIMSFLCVMLLFSEEKTPPLKLFSTCVCVCVCVCV